MCIRFSLLSLSVSLFALPAALAQMPPPLPTQPPRLPAPQYFPPPAAKPTQPVPYPLNLMPSSQQGALTGVYVLPTAPAIPIQAPPGTAFIGPAPITLTFSVALTAPLKPQTHVFEVYDLVHSPVQVPGAAAMDHGKSTNAHMLMKLIVAMTEPKSWERGGGTGKIEYVEASDSLVVTNYPATLAEVQKLLAGLRRMQDQQLALEMHIVAVPAGFGAKVGWPTEAGSKCCSPAELQKALQELKADKRTSTISQPKLTLIDGQMGFFQMGQSVPYTQLTQVGMKGTELILKADELTMFFGTALRCTPTISMDGKSVALKMSSTHNEPNIRTVSRGNGATATPIDTLECQANVVLPNGNSAVLFLGAKDADEVTEIAAPPIVSKIPYLNRLFKNQRIETKTKMEYYQIVTARILKPEAETVKVVGHVDATAVFSIPSCQPECNGLESHELFYKPSRRP